MNTKVNPDDTGVIDYSQYTLTKSLAENVAVFKLIFEHDDTVNYRFFENRINANIKCCAIFVDGMIQTQFLNDNIITPVIMSQTLLFHRRTLQDIKLHGVCGNSVEEQGDIAKLVGGLIYGDTLLLIDGFDTVLDINTKGWMMRSISEPDDEKSLKGSREGFTETMLINLSMLRRRLQTSDLKFEFRKVGTRTETHCCLAYLDSLVDKNVLADLKKRLDALEIDGSFDVHAIEELIRDHKMSIFKTTGTTEKPDICSSKMLEGRIAIIMDGTPIVVTVPHLHIESFQAPDDYYLSFYYAGFGRLLRFLSFFASMLIPGIFVAIVSYHPELLPIKLFNNIAASSKGVPFPPVIECLGLLLIFEILRETGIRMPDKIGQALSIVGALIIGQAAVEAKFVSTTMVIIVATTGMCGLMVPRLKGASLLLRFANVIVGSIYGLFGISLLLIAINIYVYSMRSFGVNFMDSLLPLSKSQSEDSFVRLPFMYQKSRPASLTKDRTRAK